MIIFLTIAVAVLALIVLGILFYLWWMPVKIKKMIAENDELNDIINEELNNLKKEEDSND